MVEEHQLEEFIIQKNASVIEAMSVINENGKGLVFVCDNFKIIGVLTDGDIRRFILSGGNLQEYAGIVANKNFKYLTIENMSRAKKLFKTYKIKVIPVLDDNENIVRLYFDNNLVVEDIKKFNAPVVIMAGGKGTRLHPYTKILPKPLVPINGVPISMHIMQKYAEYGCKDYFMIVNHQKNLIKAYYSQEEIPFDVSYIDETIPLGTGGGLKYLEGKVKAPFFMNNCDVLIDICYSDLYDDHINSNSIITLVCAMKKTTIPYGTVEVSDDGKLKDFVEKPSYSYLANTGVYVISPKFLDYLIKDEFIHITDAIERCMEKGENVNIYPIADTQWHDMGQLNELEKMENALGAKDE